MSAGRGPLSVGTECRLDRGGHRHATFVASAAPSILRVGDICPARGMPLRQPTTEAGELPNLDVALHPTRGSMPDNLLEVIQPPVFEGYLHAPIRTGCWAGRGSDPT